MPEANDISIRPNEPETIYKASIWQSLSNKALACILLILLSPLLITIVLLIKLDSAGPIFLRVERIGQNRKPITLFKFRTMYVWRSDPIGVQRTVASDPRITRIGRVLRLKGLDELPQLINIIRGDMAFVGPRPALAYERLAYERLAYEQRHYTEERFSVLPGLTGLWQVNRSSSEISSLADLVVMQNMDLEYVRNRSLWLDIKIIMRALRNLVTGNLNAY